MNTASSLQTGGQHQSDITQTGDGNTTTVTQSGN